ncbi:hypothetical protein GY45DRAFT_461350 [Cubamyces sp. BRFM 1775]|nr:hypothetical protein GY45DRAFT_461350 [Cubamyces sp. BRFM 1775]
MERTCAGRKGICREIRRRGTGKLKIRDSWVCTYAPARRFSSTRAPDRGRKTCLGRASLLLMRSMHSRVLIASVRQLLARVAHDDKSPTIALILAIGPFIPAVVEGCRTIAPAGGGASKFESRIVRWRG